MTDRIIGGLIDAIPSAVAALFASLTLLVLTNPPDWAVLMTFVIVMNCGRSGR